MREAERQGQLTSGTVGITPISEWMKQAADKTAMTLRLTEVSGGATYGDRSVEDVMRAEMAEREGRECETCAGWPCKKSRNKGYKPTITVDEQWGLIIGARRCRVYEQRIRQAELERRFKNARIPVRYLGKTLADYAVDEQNRVAVEFARQLLKQEISGAYFQGEVGTGKTFLAALIAQEFLRAGKTVLFENVADLLTEFYEIYRGHSKATEQELLTELYEVELLILDDFGLEKPTQYVGTTFCKILDARYNRLGVTTIITSNYTATEVKERLDNPTDNEGFCLNGS